MGEDAPLADPLTSRPADESDIGKEPHFVLT